MTKSQKIEMNESFDKYFILDGNQIMLDYNNIDNIDSLYIRINADDLNIDLDEYSMDHHIMNSDEGEDDYVTIEELYCTKFDIVTEDGEIVDTIKSKNSLQLNINDYLYNLIERYNKNKKFTMIPLSNIDDEDSLFTIDVNNAELTKTLNQVKDLLENEYHLGCTTIDELVETLNRLLIEGKIYTNIVHCEVLCRNLLRSTKDIMRFPDLESGEEYQIMTVKKALMTNPSPIVSLSFERIKEQIKGTLLFRKRGCSMFDNLFREKYHAYYDVPKKKDK